MNKILKQADDSSFIPFRARKWFIGYSCASRRTRVRFIQPLWLLCRLECCLTPDFSFKDWRQGIPGASWLTQLATLTNSGFDHETTSQKSKVEGQSGNILDINIGLPHACAHMCSYICEHEHTHKYMKKWGKHSGIYLS